MMTESAEDLNLSFVVDEANAERLVSRLHATLIDLVVRQQQCDTRGGYSGVWTSRLSAG